MGGESQTFPAHSLSRYSAVASRKRQPPTLRGGTTQHKLKSAYVVRAMCGAPRQGQLTRFEYALLAAFGEEYVERHPSSLEYRSHLEQSLAALRDAGIETNTSELPPDPDR